MNLPAEWVAIACGIVTFLLRLVPMWTWVPGKESTRVEQGVLNAIGPAAITALLVVSLWPGGDNGLHLPTLSAMVVGLATVMGAKRVIGGVALPTLFGAIAYGACLRLA
ncbi:AzlD domain-containing protein [Azoarcus sp. DN11]|uniref:AzlD domain-containing protein n=1 Tax=Azoarcus sp. DN11 TaxID=356837 RepID=UPI000EB4984C|nr:AzlD domain-containing protein [Azoarcus sp. DN11]AYH43907.1 hypothetical protein CDA09_10990 [Azoarcus sp. DN11]